MNNTLKIGRYSFGIGDRFAHQARAPTQAVIFRAFSPLEFEPPSFVPQLRDYGGQVVRLGCEVDGRWLVALNSS